MFLRAGYYGRTGGGGSPDMVPDGAGSLPVASWNQIGVTKTTGSTPPDPPIITITEQAGSSLHLIYAGSATVGPQVRTKWYLQAGSRRYVGLSPTIADRGVTVVVDTTDWTMTQANGTGGAGGDPSTIISATRTDLGNGDNLIEIVSNHGTAGAENACLTGSLTSTPARAPTYDAGAGGSTILIRRYDLNTETLPISLGAGTVTKAATTGTTLTGTTQHTPSAAAGVTSCIIRYICRNTLTSTHNPITATFGGQSVVFPSGSQAASNGSVSRAFVGIGYVTGLTPGVAGSLAITCNRVMGQMVARIDDVPNLAAANIGAVGASTVTTTTPTKTSHGQAITVQAASSILLGVVGGVSGSIDPLTVSGGFTEQAEDVTGTAATDVAAAFGTKTGGAAATVETMTATSATSIVYWGGAVLELKVYP